MDPNEQYFDSAKDQEPFPAPQTKSAIDDSKLGGFVVHGIEDTPGKKAYLIRLEAKPGKEEQVQGFLQDIHNGVNKEPGTGPWFGARYSKTTFLIFEAFPDAAARHAHDAGPGGQNFFTRSDELKEMLAYPAQLYRMDIMHGKFNVFLGQEIAELSLV
ncbi:hypothetical protein BAUCODRAFT_146794 [Baudoinia panamericana UAMH 10762]|uniref:ABM domain-containing protein n=1 Tax=Baudoinia panamericana (strain UAMH 10762) TaxID=717646 RepID=M2NG18_BAUPA|nr:uncharacterized protein BAUCODRAFT_146794 [Baudoinia panamericana UAMH 10762]EMC98234.1 hypothetical protein BAUCODRAFT_146794 [Baudoinia panamericana UAMH 10762]